jgi:hypothetical protein
MGAAGRNLQARPKILKKIIGTLAKSTGSVQMIKNDEKLKKEVYLIH